MAGSKAISNNRDVLDKVFEWTERFLCPTPKTHDELRNMPEPKTDMLDYVFEHTESLVCHQQHQQGDGDEDHPYLLEEGQQDMQRDNSLIEPGEQIMTTNRRQRQRPIKSIGQEGDVIDYVFEHVESLVCVDSSALECAPQAAQDMRTQAGQKRGERFHYTEQEDDIQVEFVRAKSWGR